MKRAGDYYDLPWAPTLAYATAPPRTGTTMIARAMSVVVPAHHECQSRTFQAGGIALAAWAGGQPELGPLPDHGALESGWYYTFMTAWLKAPVIHLWRPAEPWVRSMLGRNLDASPGHAGRYALQPPMDDTTERLCWVYNEYHRHLLKTAAMRVRIGEVPWDRVCELMGITPTPEQLERIEYIEGLRPNSATDPNPELTDEQREVIAERCAEVEAMMAT